MKEKNTEKPIPVAVLGGSGYAGGELLRLLHLHPRVELRMVTSERYAGKPVTAAFPHLTGYARHRFVPMEAVSPETGADLFFLALPHRTAQKTAAALLRAGRRVIDFSADFRLRDPAVYEQWYGTPHTERAALRRAVYGLPEIHRRKIRRAALVANPGCYPTSALLGLLPALKKGLVRTRGIVIDSKSGVSGAGRSPRTPLLFSEVNDAFRAYGLATHRHTPEIEQEISGLAGRPVIVEFSPHLVPMDRGILTTIYAQLRTGLGLEEIHALYRKAYAREPFVQVLPPGELPATKNVRGTNHCHIGLVLNPRTGRLLIVSAIDNLTKGAAGQAVQNMNLMAGFEETTGLEALAVFP